MASNFFQQTEAFLYDEMCDMAMGRLPSKCYASCGAHASRETLPVLACRHLAMQLP